MSIRPPSPPFRTSSAPYRSPRRGLSLVAAAGPKEWDENFLAGALTAIAAAAAKGFPTVAEAVQELTPIVAAEFLEWFRAR
jgi:hypothetical protein